MVHQSRIRKLASVIAIAGSALLWSTGSFAQGNPVLHFYNCAFLDDIPGTVSFAIYLEPLTPVTQVRFRVESDPGLTLTYMSEVRHLDAIGDSQTGMMVCFGDCWGGSEFTPMVTMTYMAYGTTEGCARIRIVPYPGAETVEAIDCEGTPIAVTVEDQYVLGEALACFGCPNPYVFPGTPRGFSCQPLPVETSTWGRVKALYRE